MANKKQVDLLVLLTKKQHLYKSVEATYDLSKATFDDPSKISLFLLRVKHLEKTRNEFYDICDKINALKAVLEPEEQADISEMLLFDDLYYAILEVAEAHQPRGEPVAMCSASSVNAVKPQVRLPKIELPKFSGNIENWSIFIDIYTPLVHNNSDLTNIEKFHYLASCLSGSALSIVKNVPMTDKNYSVVFKALCERYENERVLASTYLDKIFKLKPITLPSFDELSRFTNILNESVNALKALNIENLGEFVLFYVAFRSLDSETKQKFEEQNSSSKGLPTFEQLSKFLNNRLRVLELSKPSSTTSAHKFHFKASVAPKAVASTSDNKRSFVVTKPDSQKSQSQFNCPCCNLQHTIYKCSKLKAMDVPARRATIVDLKLCTNCLRPFHKQNDCLSKTSCLSCGKRHNTLLHVDESGGTSSGAASLCISENDTVTPDEMSTTLACTDSQNSAFAGGSLYNQSVKLLGSAVIRLRDSKGYTCEVRALIDSCSQDCFMTVSCARRLGLPIRRSNASVAGLGESLVRDIQGVTFCSVLPRKADSPQFNLPFVLITKITSEMPVSSLPRQVRKQFEHLDLADPSFDKSSKIDVLLGVEIFDQIYDGQRYTPGPNMPTALHSIYGWVITGQFKVPCELKHPSAALLVASTHNLEDLIQRFWELEEPPCKRLSHPEDDLCEAIYTKLMYREPDGRYVVPIMAKEDFYKLGDSYRRSLNRFINLEKRLARNQDLKQDYAHFIKEYEELGHMSPCFSEHNDTYIIPHHCVIRPSSVTTKLRVVFDASCKTTNDLSLNDIVYTGPKLQVDIIDIITRFRLFKVVFTADICKMYRQINIIPKDRHYQHILWRASPELPIQEYELNTVTYGVSSSPYLAIRTLRQLAKDYIEQYPRSAEVLCEETFMDDVTTGATSTEAAIQLRDDIIEHLKQGQFELRKWSSNDPAVLQDLPSEHCQQPKIFDETDVSLKILGIKWDPKVDRFSYDVKDLDIDAPTTKRKILSVVARIFDPLGWVSPVVLTAKLIIQDLWKLQLSWDEQVPENLQCRWKKFAAHLKELETIQLPRYVLSANPIEVNLVGFCDGSSKGYGCCVYLVASSTAGKSITISLLTAKSKVAPTKTSTVNRLELCGALLLARVLRHVHDLLKAKICIHSVVAYTDSTTVLAWLKTEPCKLKMFVANRVVQIFELLGDIAVWRHVSTVDNPADCCSRGVSVPELTSHTLWWQGPSWLSLPSPQWPDIIDSRSIKSEVPELKKEKTNTLLISTADIDFIEEFSKRFSSWLKMQRTLAWIKRFIKNVKSPLADRRQSSLSVSELRDARDFLIEKVQNDTSTKSLSPFKKAFLALNQFKNYVHLLIHLDSCEWGAG